MVEPFTKSGNPWRLRGTSLQVASFGAAAFTAAAVLVALVDRYSQGRWDSPLLQAWTLIPQALATAGLLHLAKVRNSKAFGILGGLIGLIVIEEAFHVLNPLAAWLARVARWANRWSDVRLSVLDGVLIYGFVALVGLGLLAFSHWHSSPDERPVIRNIALLLLAGGLFGGPISVLSTMGHRRRWVFVEEVGEAIVFALMAGYVAGLVVAASGGRSDRPRSTLARRFGLRERP